MGTPTEPTTAARTDAPVNTIVQLPTGRILRSKRPNLGTIIANATLAEYNERLSAGVSGFWFPRAGD